MRNERQEVLLLVVLPAGLAIGMAIAAVRQASEAGATGAIVALGAAAVGVMLLPLLQRMSSGPASANSGSRRWLPGWFTPVLFAGIASVPFWSSFGHAAQAAVFALGAAFLASFAVAIAIKMRARSRAGVLPLQ
jgi:hypothetical protein